MLFLSDHPETLNGAPAVNEGSSAVFVTGHGKPFDPRVITAKESMKAKVNAIRKKLVEQVSFRHLSFIHVPKKCVKVLARYKTRLRYHVLPQEGSRGFLEFIYRHMGQS